METSVTKEFRFCAAHRLVGHEGACQYLHGHNYRALVTVRADGLDNVGRIIDFSMMKSIIGKWIDDNWDHKVILSVNDPAYKDIADWCKDGAPYVMKCNPTAENMASELMVKCRGAFAYPIELTSVTLYETETSYATVES